MAKLSVDERNRRASQRQLAALRTAKRDVLYLSGDGKLVTTWTGDVAGRVTHLLKRSSPIGRYFYNLRFTDIYGNHWTGTSPGPNMYVRARRMGFKANPRQSLRDFIRQHRAEIDTAIRRAVPNARIDDEERRLWVLNDEGLYMWARSEGARI